MEILSSIQLFAVFYSIYCIAVVIYRLYAHPLSHFPGPKIAACSLWYEFYYDVVLAGKWTERIKRMHDRYGPIVRINPHELHICDPHFYQEIYAPTGGGQKRNKYQWWVNTAAAPGSMFATVDHNHHRLRRAPLNNFFSKNAVTRLESQIWAKIQKLCDRFAKAAERRDVVRADCAFMAVTMDVICEYCFGEDRAYLDHDNFGLEWNETITGAVQKGAVLRAFPWMLSFVRAFPRSLARILDPNMAMSLAWQDSVRNAVQPILEHRDGQAENSTIFHTLRDSDLPPEERSLRRLCDEGEIFTGAGSETTAKALTTILYYLTTQADCLKQLQDELKSTMPHVDSRASWAELEQLPYLSAVIQEGLRLSYGLTTRLPRVASEDLKYKNWTIPAGTPVSETPYLVLVDPEVFPEPHVFRPARWLEDGRRLDRYQVSFGKGSRMCIGVNLAYAELYMTCAAIYRRFTFELHDTSLQDIEMVHDFFVAAPKQPARGVRVRIIDGG